MPCFHVQKWAKDLGSEDRPRPIPGKLGVISCDTPKLSLHMVKSVKSKCVMVSGDAPEDTQPNIRVGQLLLKLVF